MTDWHHPSYPERSSQFIPAKFIIFTKNYRNRIKALSKTALGRFLGYMARIGSDAEDNEEVRLQKTLLIVFSGSMAVLALIWSGIYFFFDELLSASIPFVYALISFTSLALFAKHKSYNFYLVSQLILSLFLPFFLMVTLGGYASSSVVIIWSFTSPLGALVLKGRKEALHWFFWFVLLLILAAFLEGHYAFTNNLPEAVVLLFFFMNIAGMSFITFIVVRYFIGEKNLALNMLQRKNRWIKEAFSAYVSPNLVDHLMANPEELKLGGERRECTFVFTDLVGFTPLVEQSDPATLVSYLNEYFESMTEIVFKHQGTVSKIVGDALSVMFSAPVVQHDHAQRAVACALEMDAFAQQFAKEKSAIGLDLGNTRIGVNTGSVIIGNIGSKNQLDYRALGDAINTAARLESANKQLGTRVCVSETTVAQCQEFLGRPIGALLLKGKTKPVLTYEPLDPHMYNESQFKTYCRAFEIMDKEVSQAIVLLEALVQDFPEDGLAAYHLDRLKSGKSGSTIILPWK